MIKKFAAFGLCAAIALSPMAALAQAAAPDATAPAADAAKPMADTTKPMKKSKSHKSHMSTSHMSHKKSMKKPMEDKSMAPAEAPQELRPSISNGLSFSKQADRRPSGRFRPWREAAVFLALKPTCGAPAP